MKLAISNLAWPEAWEPEIYNTVKQYGFTAIEVAPTRIFPQTPYEDLARAKAWAAELRQSQGLEVCSLQSIWYGRTERLFASKEERRFLLSYTKQAIDFAQAVGAGNLVFGSPKNRRLEPGEHPDAALPFFRELGEYAQARGTTLSLEANPPLYGTNFCTATAQALDWAQAVDRPAFQVNLDLGTMIANGEGLEVLTGRLNLIHHIHISEPGMKALERRPLHRDLAALLRQESYTGYVAIEMGLRSSPAEIEAACAYVKEIFQ